MTGVLLRLDRVRERLRPVTCYSQGSLCDQVRLVGDGSLDPPMPDLPAICRHCGRPTRWETIVLIGVDVDLL